jgi:galactokinase
MNQMPDCFSREFKAVPVADIIAKLKDDSADLDKYLGSEIYINTDREYLSSQKKRMIKTLECHMERMGNVPTVLLRAPGRLNAFLEYLDMCGGDHMSTTIDGDIPMALSFREDDVLNIYNSNPLFAATKLSLSGEFEQFRKAPWSGSAVAGLTDNWDSRSLLFPYYGRKQGDWVNYIIIPYMKALWENPGILLRGADMTFGPSTTPFRAGVSSSSAMVVLSFLAMFFANRDRLPKWTNSQVCRFLGEAEWYVGTHGGANDQMTILFNPANSVSYNRHSREELGVSTLPFLKGVHVVLANSLWEVNKSAGGNQSFNMRKGWIKMSEDFAEILINDVVEAIKKGESGKPGWLGKRVEKLFGFVPDKQIRRLEGEQELWNLIRSKFKKLGSLSEDILGIPGDVIEEFIMLLPVKTTPEEATRILKTDYASIIRNYTNPKRNIGGYHLRTTARFFYRQNVIGRRLEQIFLQAAERLRTGELSETSDEYDAYRKEVGILVDKLQDALTFDFRVSIPQIDLLLSIAKRGPGYLGGKLTGAGKGGCVSLLVRDRDSRAMCEYLDREYYGRPESFEYYRMVLTDDIKFSEASSPDHESAVERLSNLDKALASIPENRRVVTFSRGACAIRF